MASAARARFESWCGLDAPDLPADPVDAMQLRLSRWQANNFAATSDALICLGIVEECGELDDAMAEADTFDAMGDVAIYAAQICTSNRLAIAPLIAVADEGSGSAIARRTLISSAGRLSHLVLKRAQRIREGTLPDEDYRALLASAIAAVLFEARRAAAPSRVDACRRAFVGVGESVIARDWTANRVTGVAL